MEEEKGIKECFEADKKIIDIDRPRTNLNDMWRLQCWQLLLPEDEDAQGQIWLGEEDRGSNAGGKPSFSANLKSGQQKKTSIKKRNRDCWSKLVFFFFLPLVLRYLSTYFL